MSETPRHILHLVIEGFPANRLEEIAGSSPATNDVTEIFQLTESNAREALGKIYDEVDWSFQRTIPYANWLCPGQVASSGTFTVTPYSNTITGSQAATQQINGYIALPGSAILTTLQYRDPAYSIYNIVKVGGDGTVSYVNLQTGGSGQTP